jgi:hypothetical protein
MLQLLTALYARSALPRKRVLSVDYNDRVSSIKSYTGFSCIGVVQREIVNPIFFDELAARAAGY